MRLKKVCLIFLLALALVSPALASETVGTVSASHAYAWGENLGWINLAPTNTSDEYVGVTVTDSGLSGYGWSSKYGWINFQPSNSSQSVANTSEGSLSGAAWVSGLGWLDLGGISISDNGVFAGTAGTSGNSVGRVTFDCDNCSVQTDWRPASARTETETGTGSGNGSSGGSGFIGNISHGVTNAITTISENLRNLLLNLLNLIRQRLFSTQMQVINQPEPENVLPEVKIPVTMNLNKNPENNSQNNFPSSVEKPQTAPELELEPVSTFSLRKKLGVLAIFVAGIIASLWLFARLKYNK
ncbi:MAG: hypothetical protein AAB364_01800 [Patescibacteria group bacterium]